MPDAELNNRSRPGPKPLVAVQRDFGSKNVGQVNPAKRARPTRHFSQSCLETATGFSDGGAKTEAR